MNAAWKLVYRRWRNTPRKLEPGYTILLLLPGDLPVFMRLAMDVCAHQDLEHVKEILVIVDVDSPRFRNRFEVLRRAFDRAPIRYVPLPAPDRWITKVLGNPHHNCFLQLMNGIDHARTTHVLMHDADLFIRDSTMLRSHFETAASGKYACCGVSPVWDAWFSDNGYAHLVATWEILIDVAWAREFPPYLHRGHRNQVDGKDHVFDITLLPQCLTPPDRIKRHDADWGFVHFNYVISTYRHFLRAEGPFEDEHFRLLLIRLLVDTFDDESWPYAVPPLAELVDALNSNTGRVTYSGTDTAGHFPEFRRKLEDLISIPHVTQSHRRAIEMAVKPFDTAFGWSRQTD